MNDLAVTLRGTETTSRQIEIRPLRAGDADAYRSLRQRILDLGDGRYFSDSYERERQLIPAESWRDWCTEKREHCIIGTFAAAELIGAMMITRHGAADSPIVEWEGTWLDPMYRKHKIAKSAYEHVYQWSLDQGFSFAVAFIRADNQRSVDIRRQQGFAYAYSVYDETWADGSVADTNAYVMGLRAPTAAERRQIALDHLPDVLAFLNHGPHAPPKQEASFNNPATYGVIQSVPLARRRAS